MKLSGTHLAIIALLVLVLAVGGGNLWATYDQNHALKAAIASQNAASAKAGRTIEMKLCTSFGELAALKPPSGDASSNPSRAYEQRQHDILAGVSSDIDCPKG